MLSWVEHEKSFGAWNLWTIFFVQNYEMCYFIYVFNVNMPKFELPENGRGLLYKSYISSCWILMFCKKSPTYSGPNSVYMYASCVIASAQI